ncbi:MAG: helix-turn-helix domain-containing protein [Candidatus Caldarchaeum sp.]
MVLTLHVARLLDSLRTSPTQLAVVVKNSNCKVVQMLLSKNFEGTFKNIRVGENTSSHLIHLSKPVDARDVFPPDTTVYTMGRSFLWIDAPSCKACKTLSRNSAIPNYVMFIKGVGVLFSFLTPGPIVSKKIVDSMKAEGLEVNVLRRSSLNLRQVLTEKQSDVLFTAISMGYFSPQREASLRDIAEKLGLSKSTVSRHLRAAVRKLALSLPTERL